MVHAYRFAESCGGYSGVCLVRDVWRLVLFLLPIVLPPHPKRTRRQLDTDNVNRPNYADGLLFCRSRNLYVCP